MIVTEIRAQKRRKNRYNIYDEDGFFMSLADETIVRYGIKPGVEIDADLLEELRAEDTYKYANELAAQYLSYAPRSKKQLKDHLAKKGIDEHSIERTAELMESYGYINDEAYAKEYAAAYEQKLSPVAISYKLRSKGISKETAEAIAAETDSDAAARAVMKKLSRKFKNDEKRKERLMQALMRRGFSYGDFADNYSEDVWED